MATVDLAAHTALRRLMPDCNVDLYALGERNLVTYQPGDLPYEHVNILTDPQRFLAADVILFWGDFVHSHAYWKYDVGLWSGGADGKPAATVLSDNALSYMFLSGHSTDDLGKAVIFGSTLITNTAESFIDTPYAAAFNRLFKGAGGVLLRDALSAAKVSLLRGHEATLGCDPAFLLQDSDLHLLDDYEETADRSGLGVFFGRSPRRVAMHGLARALGGHLRQECRWVPWFPTRRLLRYATRPLGMSIPAGHQTPGAILAQLGSCRFLLTDTYHACVNAWRLGIPAVCIGQGAATMENSLGDKKKEILYEMLGAQSLYIFTENIGSSRERDRQAKRLAALLNDRSYIDEILVNVRNYAGSAESSAVDGRHFGCGNQIKPMPARRCGIAASTQRAE